MKFTIELEDFWMDSDSSDIETELKDYISGKVKNEIYKSIEDKVKEQITIETKKLVEETYKTKIIEYVSSHIENDSFMYHGSLITIKDYVRKEFERGHGWASPNSKIQELSKQFGDEMKKRYDMQFASGIVAKLHEHQLLKDENLNKLLGN